MDGRPIRLGNKTYAATNYLLQSCGAILCKAWLLRSHELLQEAELDYRPLGFIHDEQQLSVHPDHAEQAAFLLVAAMKDVQKQFNFRCELDAESVIGIPPIATIKSQGNFELQSSARHGDVAQKFIPTPVAQELLISSSNRVISSSSVM